MIASLLIRLARVISGARPVWTKAIETDRQRIFFANHTSHLDFLVIWSALPRAMRARTRPVAGRDYWMKGPVRRHLSGKVLNAILIERSPASSSPEAKRRAAGNAIDWMAAEMGSEYSVIVFPEGTRGTGDEISPFKSGLYYLARLKPDVELVPVYLDNMNRILPKGEALPVPMLGRVVFGEPMELRRGEHKEQFLARARSALEELREGQG
ncbi:MAG TPA: lysophospholipid acyltransferase family protein [Gemmatimonadaceae bacterium]|nr:lysophospholipid acyltransferase family protein [Gemmatimonadaceae bacterium]